MRDVILLFSALAALSMLSCDNHEVSDNSEHISALNADKLSGQQNLYDEVWMMRGWQGHMCVVLAITDNHCEQWFYSDVGNTSDRNKPKDCEVRKIDGGFKLVAETSDEMYATKWIYVEEDDQTFLASADDIEAGKDNGRWLRKVNPKVFCKYLETGGPFILHMNPQLESE